MLATQPALVDRGDTLPGLISEDRYVLPPGLPYERWVGIGETLQQMQRSINWWAGDWLAYGEQEYGQRAYQAVTEATGRGDSSLRQAVWISTTFPPVTRVTELSWSHHRVVADCEPDDRAELLAEAVRDQLSTRELAARARQRKAVGATVSTCAADAPWQPGPADLTTDVRRALYAEATARGVVEVEAFAAGWTAALAWAREEAAFSAWPED